MDFQFDATAVGRKLKFHNVIDEHSRLFLANRVCRRSKVEDVVAVLDEHTSLYQHRRSIAVTTLRSSTASPMPKGYAHDLPQEMEREQRHQNGLHRARITVAERLC